MHRFRHMADYLGTFHCSVCRWGFIKALNSWWRNLASRQ